jgi:ParB/Sulfiredoxin domain
VPAVTPPHHKPKFDYVAQDKLEFDPTNPRFHTGSAAKTQEQIQSLLEKEPHLALQLVDSFLENGFIDYEPLVVRKDGDKYIVVEGNRRLAAIRHILRERSRYGDRDGKIAGLRTIPVLVFPGQNDEADRKQQRVYLGVRHLFGFREWPAESKARFLDNQIRTATDLQRTMKELNIKRTEIRRYLIPFRLRREARTLWERYRDQDFWVLGEGLNRTGIRAYIELDVDPQNLRVRSFNEERLKNLLEFIYGASQDGKLVRKRIKETRDLSLLSKVLESRKATAEIEKGRMVSEASLFIESRGESLQRLKRLIDELKLLLSRVLAKQSDSQRVGPLLTHFRRFEEAANKFLKDAKESNI